MNISEADILRILPRVYRAGAVLSLRDSRLVLRVTRTDGGPPRILKCVVPPCAPEEQEAFRREFLLLDALQHPCWVRPLHFGALAGDGHYLEMEEAPGVTLSHWPIRGWWPETLTVAHQILSGLEVLHRLGYAHLDLGLEQVLVESAEAPTPWETKDAGAPVHVRLLDLGLAARFGEEVGARGTPGSIAPELLRHRPSWDARADLYSAGTILYELFTGHPPFPGRTVRDVLTRQLEGPEPDPGEEADLPPPVRDLVRELLAKDPDSRPHSALEIWQRLRDQAPRDRAGALPPFLVAGDEFVFVGRDAEVSAFDSWLASLDPERADARCDLIGEPGIGCRRLAARLSAVAESRGWIRDDTAASERLRHLHGANLQIAIAARPAPGQTPGSAAGGAPEADRRPAALHGLPGATPVGMDRGRQPDANVLPLSLGPMSDEILHRILAAAGIESELLRLRLAETSLGSPGLLAGLVAVLPREIDLAVRHGGEERLDATLDTLALPPPWCAWSRQLLDSLDAAGASALVHAGIAGLPRMPDASTLGLAELPETLRPAASRKLLRDVDGRWQARSGVWARALVEADHTRTAEIGRALLRDLDRSGTEVARVRLNLLLRDVNGVARSLPQALRVIVATGHREEALQLHGEAARLGSGALRELREKEMLGLLEGVFGLGMRSGSILHEPGEWCRPAPEGADGVKDAGAAAALALLETWAWIGRQRRDLAEDALLRAESLLPDRADRGDPLTFLAGWFRYRLLDAERSPTESRQALERLRDRLPPDDHRRRLACDVSEAQILGKEGRHEDALSLLGRGVRASETLEEGEQAAVLVQLAISHQRGGSASPAAAMVASAEAKFRRTGCTQNRLIAANLMGVIAFQDGDLRGAQAWTEDPLREWTVRGHWNEVGNALVSLTLFQLEQGRLGEALRTVIDATVLLEHATQPSVARRVASVRARVLSHCGLTVRAAAEARGFLAQWESSAPAATLFVRATLGEILLARGQLEEGRSEFRRAVAGFLATGMLDDAAEILARWGLAETALGLTEAAQGYLGEIGPLFRRTSGLTKSAIALLEVETVAMSAGDWPTANAISAAQRAVSTLEAQGRWSLAWRANWCLARAYARAGSPREAMSASGSARTVLMNMAESLAMVTRVDGFLRLPAVSEFLAHLE